ncbi:MAG: DUF4424 domain-containing protein [Acidobacteriia bacterium]|nr:DUF4424 domain-containing protein [Terriglobia bacterium]
MRRYAMVAALFMCIATWPAARANDSAASSAAGGIRLKREPRISMAKEKLTISTKKITVEYEFINESDQDITTEVAFPVPPYRQNMSPQGDRTFSDFRLWVNGVLKKYKTESKATLNGKDCSALLRKYRIDIASLGHYIDNDKEGPASRDFRNLSKPLQEELINAGFFDRENQFPEWSVEKTYHWQQTFPAHQVLHVRHEYEPGIGFIMVDKDQANTAKPKLAPQNKDLAGYPSSDQFAYELHAACVDPKLREAITKSASKHGHVSMQWVDYILTTANSWKRPIKSFELIVEKSSRKDYSTRFVSFCWDGRVERVEQNGFRATAIDFVPKADLHVAFFDMPKTGE